MSRELPERPNLDQLKKQAKSLLHAAEKGDADALSRFALLPSFSEMSAAELRSAGLALHDAQSVIAREHGFPSWNALREEVQALPCRLPPRWMNSSPAPQVAHPAGRSAC